MVLLRKVNALLSPRQRRGAVILVALTIVGMVLETVGLGLVIPVLGLLTNPQLASDTPVLRWLIERAGNPAAAQIVLGGMAGLLTIHVVRVTFLGYLAWRQ